MRKPSNITVKVVDQASTSPKCFFNKSIKNKCGVVTFIYLAHQKQYNARSSVQGLLLKHYYQNLEYNKSIKHWATTEVGKKKEVRSQFDKMMRQFRKDVVINTSHCAYCEVELDHVNKNLTNSSSVDHFKPICKQGTNDLANLRVCCLDCNIKKRDTDPITQKKQWQVFLAWTERKKMYRDLNNEKMAA